MKTLEVTSPGKLYLMGEYSILTPGQTAVIVPAPFYLTAKIHEADAYELSSELLGGKSSMTPDKDYALLQEVVRLVETFLKAKQYAIKPFHLAITGRLGQGGKKFGLGSSGCVVVLVVKALLTFYNYQYTQDELFKLAALVLLKRGDTGSLGDLACISHESLVAYRSFDREAVRRRLEHGSVLDLMAQDWGYEITPLEASGKWYIQVGWTKQPALSHQMVSQVKDDLTQDFKDQMNAATLDFIQALETNDKAKANRAFQVAGELLQDLSATIYTPALMQLVELAESLQLAAKSSGAGGGDCGLALCDNLEDARKLAALWEAHAILPLATIRLGE